MAVTTVSNSLILRGWVTKILNNDDKKWRGGGGKVGDNNILSFVLLYSIKNATFLFIFNTCLPIH